MRHTHAWLLLPVLCAGCAAHGRSATATNAPTQVADAIRVALSVVENGEKQQVVIVVDRALDPATRVAAQQVRRTISRDAVRQTKQDSLPRGYFLLTQATVGGDRARVVGVLGPIPKPVAGFVMMGCGAGYTIDLQREGSTWKVVGVRLEEC